MIKLLLIRHALTDSAGRRLTGRMPGISLNSEGQRQAHRLADYLKGLKISAIFSSPLERAIETARPIEELTGIRSIVSEDFNEIDFGQWTDHTIEELRSNREFQLFNSSRSVTRIPGGELMSEAQLRIVRGIEKIRLVRSEQRVAVVSHADMIRLAIAYYAGIHLDMMGRIEISPASISIIEFYDSAHRIVLVNGNPIQVTESE